MVTLSRIIIYFSLLCQDETGPEYGAGFWFCHVRERDKRVKYYIEVYERDKNT